MYGKQSEGLLSQTGQQNELFSSLTGQGLAVYVAHLYPNLPCVSPQLRLASLAFGFISHLANNELTTVEGFTKVHLKWHLSPSKVDDLMFFLNQTFL